MQWLKADSRLMRTMYALVPQLTGSPTTEGSNFNLFATTPLRDHGEAHRVFTCRRL
jgi:hypothetical protein